ncbi:MAG: heavy metal-binding domain-containing protein, partial [Syntrophobacter sp.]
MLPEHDRNTREAGGERGRSDRPKRKALKILLLLILFAATAWGSYNFRGSSAETWLAGIAAGTSRADTGNQAVYYCPMHPDYHSNKPGTCPICGMNLVKADPEEESSQAAGAPENKQAGGGKVLYWVDPMNPSMKFDKPGKAPDGMDLQPVYGDETGSSRSLPPGSVMVCPQKRRVIG